MFATYAVLDLHVTITLRYAYSGYIHTPNSMVIRELYHHPNTPNCSLTSASVYAPFVLLTFRRDTLKQFMRIMRKAISENNIPHQIIEKQDKCF